MQTVKYLASMLESTVHHALVALSIPWFLLLLVGCAQVSGAASHGWEGVEYENTYLSTGSPLGAKALNNWQDFDIDVRQFLRRNRAPDVIYSKHFEVTFFYLRERVQVHFNRPAVGFKTAIRKSTIPDTLYQFLQTRFQGR